MTLFTLVLGIAIAAAIVTALVGVVYKKHKSWLLTFLQNFSGILFLFSGVVKAIDPMGTAFKMADYFKAFKTVTDGSWLEFISPMWDVLAEYKVAFSVIFIVLEIIIGAMLILGAKKKLTSWLFLLIVLFFTVLTGYTYLTGYVPSGTHFFDFGGWAAFKETNQQVTDCGCFGDFLKLEPFQSFMKDVFLLIPAFLFVFKHKDMHELLTPRLLNIVTGGLTAVSLVFCLSNYVWDLPIVDFRPFAENVDVQAQKAKEEAAMAKIVTTYSFKNKTTGEEVEGISLSNYANYPKADWEMTGTSTTEPEVKQTKISQYAIESADFEDVTDSLLNMQGYSFMVVCRNPKQIIDKETGAFKGWDPDYKAPFDKKITPFMNKAMEKGYPVYAVTKYEDGSVVDNFRHATQSAYPFYQADEILLKTIIRSNPGVVLWNGSTIVKKWHKRKLPEFEEVEAEFLK